MNNKITGPTIIFVLGSTIIIQGTPKLQWQSFHGSKNLLQQEQSVNKEQAFDDVYKLTKPPYTYAQYQKLCNNLTAQELLALLPWHDASSLHATNNQRLERYIVEYKEAKLNFALRCAPPLFSDHEEQTLVQGLIPTPSNRYAIKQYFKKINTSAQNDVVLSFFLIFFPGIVSLSVSTVSLTSAYLLPCIPLYAQISLASHMALLWTVIMVSVYKHGYAAQLHKLQYDYHRSAIEYHLEKADHARRKKLIGQSDIKT